MLRKLKRRWISYRNLQFRMNIRKRRRVIVDFETLMIDCKI